MVLGLSTSSSCSFPTSTSMTPSRKEIDQPTSSSSSSTSPTTTVSSDSVARQERGDLCGIDSYPAAVPSTNVERQAWRDLCSSGIPEEQLLTKPTKTSKPKKMRRITNRYGETRIIPTYWNVCKNLEKILWMTEFLNTETHTPVLLMNHL